MMMVQTLFTFKQTTVEPHSIDQGNRGEKAPSDEITAKLLKKEAIFTHIKIKPFTH